MVAASAGRPSNVVMQRERPGVGFGPALDGAHDGYEVGHAPELDTASDARVRRAPRGREPIGDRVEVLVHTALAPRVGLRTFGGEPG